MKIICGLGNPGKEYENSRHNAGFIIIDNYINSNDWKEKFNALYCVKKVNNENIIFIKPLTFMNLSGDALIKFKNYYDVDSKDIMVIRDDLDLPIGSYRLKYDSSSGGHNGIKSIINNLGTEKFLQLKIGISKADNSVVDYVLGKFSKNELDEIMKNLELYNKIIDEFIKNDYDFVISRYNKK